MCNNTGELWEMQRPRENFYDAEDQEFQENENEAYVQGNSPVFVTVYIFSLCSIRNMLG